MFHVDEKHHIFLIISLISETYFNYTLDSYYRKA